MCVCAHVFKETRHNDNDVYSAKALFSLVIVYLERLAFVETKTQVKLISFVIFVYVVFLPLPPLLLIKGGSKKKDILVQHYVREVRHKTGSVFRFRFV